jgi:hypothetical protein
MVAIVIAPAPRPKEAGRRRSGSICSDTPHRRAPATASATFLEAVLMPVDILAAKHHGDRTRLRLPAAIGTTSAAG